MKMKQLAPVVICIVIFLVSSFYTPAEEANWDQDLASATAARQRGEFAVAETLYKQAIAVQTRELGADNAAVAASMNNLAVLYQDQAQFTQAEPLYKKSVAIWKQIPGQEM